MPLDSCTEPRTGLKVPPAQLHHLGEEAGEGKELHHAHRGDRHHAPPWRVWTCLAVIDFGILSLPACHPNIWKIVSALRMPPTPWLYSCVPVEMLRTRLRAHGVLWRLSSMLMSKSLGTSP